MPCIVNMLSMRVSISQNGILSSMVKSAKNLCAGVWGGSTRFELLKMKIYEQAEVGIVPSILIDRRTRSKL